MGPITLTPAQSLSSSPTLELRWADESTSLAGLTEKSEGRRGASAVANAHVSPVSPDALGLSGTVVNTDTGRKSNPRAFTCTDEGERRRSWALRLPRPREPPASGLLAGLRKPPLQHPRRWSARHMARQAGAKGHHKPRRCMGLAYGTTAARAGERVSEHSLSRKEPALARGTHELGAAEGWTCQDMERTRQSEGRSPLGTTEGGYARTREESGRVRGTHELGTAERWS